MVDEERGRETEGLDVRDCYRPDLLGGKGRNQIRQYMTSHNRNSKDVLEKIQECLSTMELNDKVKGAVVGGRGREARMNGGGGT